MYNDEESKKAILRLIDRVGMWVVLACAAFKAPRVAQHNAMTITSEVVTRTPGDDTEATF